MERREVPKVRNKWAKGIVQSGVAGDHVIFDKGIRGEVTFRFLLLLHLQVKFIFARKTRHNYWELEPSPLTTRRLRGRERSWGSQTQAWTWTYAFSRTRATRRPSTPARLHIARCVCERESVCERERVCV